MNNYWNSWILYTLLSIYTLKKFHNTIAPLVETIFLPPLYSIKFINYAEFMITWGKGAEPPLAIVYTLDCYISHSDGSKNKLVRLKQIPKFYYIFIIDALLLNIYHECFLPEWVINIIKNHYILLVSLFCGLHYCIEASKSILTLMRVQGSRVADFPVRSKPTTSCVIAEKVVQPWPTSCSAYVGPADRYDT